MKTRLVRIGNSRGIRLHKPVIEEAGLGGGGAAGAPGRHRHPAGCGPARRVGGGGQADASAR